MIQEDNLPPDEYQENLAWESGLTLCTLNKFIKSKSLTCTLQTSISDKQTKKSKVRKVGKQASQ